MINLGEAKKVTFKTLLENNIKDYQFEGLSLLSKILELDSKTVITENNIEIFYLIFFNFNTLVL